MKPSILSRAACAVAVFHLLSICTSRAGSLMDGLADFLAANPTNAWECSAYGLYNASGRPDRVAWGLGGGARLGYWLRPSIGAALDLSYCDRSWTFASLALAGRGSFDVGPGRLTLYGYTGPGWNVRADLDPSVVAVAGGGLTVTLKKWPAWGVFGEFSAVETVPGQRRIVFGITRRF